MTNIQDRIELLERKAAEYQLLAQLASDPDIQLLNKQLCDELTMLARRARTRALGNQSPEQTLAKPTV